MCATEIYAFTRNITKKAEHVYTTWKGLALCPALPTGTSFFPCHAASTSSAFKLNNTI
jgi:hypothetical protein